MKNRFLKYCSVLFVLGLFLGLGKTNEAFGQCPIDFTGNALTSYLLAFPGGYSGADATFHAVVQDAAQPLPVGTYSAWCVDVNTDIEPAEQNLPGTQYSGQLFSICDPNIQGELAAFPGHSGFPYALDPTVWKQVNYILNNKGSAGFWDIQRAIFQLLGEPEPSSPPYPSYSDANVQSLVSAAIANAASWAPQCGNVIGVIYVLDNSSSRAPTDPSGPLQFVLIEVPYACIYCPQSCGTVGSPYSSAFTSTAKTPTFSIVSGNLPGGLTLDATTGSIAGTPDLSSAGTHTFTVKVVDSTSIPPQTATVDCSISIYTPVTVSCPASGVLVGVSYSSSFAPSGGSGSYTVTISSGSLPAGLTLNPTTGNITGTPGAAGTNNYTVVVKDTLGCGSATQQCSIKIYLPPSAGCANITAVQGVAITPVTLVGTGGCGGPYSFSATGLPTNLTMSASGTISGTPAVSGTFPYTIRVTDGCGNKGTNYCSVTVNPPTVFGSGDAATIGFWHNKNGQTLILSFNGGGTSTKLGNWMASNFPCMFGNLAGKTNGVVAAQFLTYFNVTGQKTYAQVMAGALACYATSSNLAGGSMAGPYGFNVSASGTGAKTYNVGTNGSAIGLVNNTSYTVFQILKAANSKCPFGTSGTVFNALNSIFDGINTTGDIQ